MQLRSILNPRERDFLKAWGRGRKMENRSPENMINVDGLGNIVQLPKARLNPHSGIDIVPHI